MEATTVKFSTFPSVAGTIQRHRPFLHRKKPLSHLSLTITSCSTTKDSTFESSQSTRGLVLDLGLSKDSWDSKEIGSPVVKRFLSDNQERWFMWYHGRSSSSDSDSIGLAISRNGFHWERGDNKVESNNDVGLVLSPCDEQWWAFDTYSVRPGEVLVMSSSKLKANSSVYWMYYTGYTNEKVESVHKSLPGLAISQDGRYWARIEGEHHSGALFDVGCEKDWDFLYISSPHVVIHVDGDLRMYYDSYDAVMGEFCIGIARSRDGIKWFKLGKVLEGGKCPCVVRDKKDGSYVMVYEGVDKDGKTSIGIAVSKDGIKDWKRLEEVVAVGEGGAWDNEGVGCPCLVGMDGEDSDHRWRLYYRGVGNGGRTGIGLAVSKGDEITKFVKHTVIKRLS